MTGEGRRKVEGGAGVTRKERKEGGKRRKEGDGRGGREGDGMGEEEVTWQHFSYLYSYNPKHIFSYPLF